MHDCGVKGPKHVRFDGITYCKKIRKPVKAQ